MPDSSMKTEDTRVHSAMPTHPSYATLTDDQLLHSKQTSSSLDPLAGVLSMSGRADPKRAFTVGQRCYHKGRKVEGTVREVAADGKSVTFQKDGSNTTFVANPELLMAL